jgi:alpha-1,6-mannosyltransferase
MKRYEIDSLFHYRVVLSGLALLCGLAFLPLCRAASVPATRVVVFLWHPLLIIETAANAHVEVLGLCFLLLSLSLLIGGHQLSPLGSLALATLVRPYPLALFPLYLRRIPIYRIVLYFLVLVAGTLPFIGAGQELWSGFADFARHGRFNPGPYLLVEQLFSWVGLIDWTRTAIAFLGLGVAAALYFTDDGTNASILRRGFYLSLPPVLLGPVVNPWYMLWVLPFLALVGRQNPLRMAILYLSGSVFLAYLYLGWGEIPLWVTWMEYGPVAVLAILGILRRGRLKSPI